MRVVYLLCPVSSFTCFLLSFLHGYSLVFLLVFGLGVLLPCWFSYLVCGLTYFFVFWLFLLLVMNNWSAILCHDFMAFIFLVPVFFLCFCFCCFFGPFLLTSVYTFEAWCLNLLYHFTLCAWPFLANMGLSTITLPPTKQASPEYNIQWCPHCL